MTVLFCFLGILSSCICSSSLNCYIPSFGILVSGAYTLTITGLSFWSCSVTLVVWLLSWCWLCFTRIFRVVREPLQYWLVHQFFFTLDEDIVYIFCGSFLFGFVHCAFVHLLSVEWQYLNFFSWVYVPASHPFVFHIGFFSKLAVLFSRICHVSEACSLVLWANLIFYWKWNASLN